MPKVFILSGCRTAIGNFQGQFEKFSASELGSIAISEAIARAKLEPQDMEQCIMGQVLTAGQGQNPGRQAAVGAKIPFSTPAYTINMLCGSGLKSVALGYQAIKNEDCGILVAGGQENMTHAQHSTYLRGTKLGNSQLVDTLLQDGLTDAFNNIHMGKTAEHLAKTFNISRSDQDKFALYSQKKAEEAIKNGYFDKEIVGVVDKRTKKVIDKDEFPKVDCTLDNLTKLRAAFDPASGTVTAGNSSGINDGAAAVILASSEEVTSKNLTPIAEILAFAEVGVDPMCMGLGPVEAVRKVLKKAGWSSGDVDLYELNEAFAVQSILCIKELGIGSNVNVTGGAIALGHPIGASGTRCLVTLINNLIRLGKKKGIVALCVGGGMGIAMAIQIR